MKIFYAMPFTGRTYKEIVEYREKVRELATKSNLDLLEQFVGVEKRTDLKLMAIYLSL